MEDMQTLLSRYNEAVATVDSIGKQLADFFSNGNGAAVAVPVRTIPAVRVPAGLVAQPTAKPGPRAGQTRTGYVPLTTKAALAMVANIPAGNARVTYDAIVKLSKPGRGKSGLVPVTAKQIEVATGLKKKAVQSSVWLLRRGLPVVSSVDISS